MEFREAVAELQENIQQIRKQHKLQRLRRFLKFFLIGFLIGRDSDKRMVELRARNNSITKSIGERIKQRECTAREQVEEIIHSGTYLTYNKKERSLKAVISFEEDLSYCDKNDVLEGGIIEAKRKKLKQHFQTISNYNKKFIEQRKKDYTYLWTKGLLSLDDEQQTAIITDDKHNLVVAAAGSGKTEVLITRIAYLIARKPDHVKPKRILAIAYQRRARELNTYLFNISLF